MIVERQYVNPMEMTFIGKDGSMGLRHGKTYRVLMFCADGYVWVSWNDRDDCMKVCPYASLNTLYANWKTPTPIPASSHKSHLLRIDWRCRQLSPCLLPG